MPRIYIDEVNICTGFHEIQVMALAAHFQELISRMSGNLSWFSGRHNLLMYRNRGHWKQFIQPEELSCRDPLAKTFTSTIRGPRRGFTKKPQSDSLLFPLLSLFFSLCLSVSLFLILSILIPFRCLSHVDDKLQSISDHCHKNHCRYIFLSAERESSSSLYELQTFGLRREERTVIALTMSGEIVI